MTIYLDREAEAHAKAEAKARGVSVSHWVAELIRKRAAPAPLESEPHALARSLQMRA